MPNRKKRSASVVWEGNLRDGSGSMSTESGVLTATQYSFRTRFAEGIGTNPDELIAASLSGCFSMALARELESVGFLADRIKTVATTSLQDSPEGWAVTQMQLEVHATVPRLSQEAFMKAALTAKMTCPIARLLNTNISMTASLN